MAGGKSQYLARAVIDHIFRSTVANQAFTYTKPGTVYIGLYSTVPTIAGGTEFASPAQGGYARAPVLNDATRWTFAQGQMTNATAISFAAASNAWPAALGIGIFDALTGGNLLYWGVLDTPITIASGGQFTFAIGALKITED